MSSVEEIQSSSHAVRTLLSSARREETLEKFVLGTLPGTTYEYVKREIANQEDLAGEYRLAFKKLASVSIVKRMICGGTINKSRLHDQEGDLLPLRRFKNIPKALSSGILKHLNLYSLDVPWISYDAIGFLESRINKDWRILEFGSGASTLWLAARAREVVSIEHDERWFNRINGKIREARICNIDYRLRKNGHEEYAGLTDFADGAFNLVMVDGIFRLSCVRTALSKIRKGGYLYLDNSDVVSDPERVEAVRIITAWAKESEGELQVYTDFAPTSLSVTKGLCACRGDR